jgi:hypothetical protein
LIVDKQSISYKYKSVSSHHLETASPSQLVLEHSEKSSSHPRPATTHPQQFIHVVEHQNNKTKRKVSTALIKSIATQKYEETFEGVTYLDLYHGKYKVVETEQGAKNLLHYHKTKGTLFSNYPLTIPQQYFASEDMAKSAHAVQEHRARTVPIPLSDPTGGTTFQPHIYRRSKSIARRYNLRRTNSVCYDNKNNTLYSPSSPSPPYNNPSSFKDTEQLRARNFNDAMEFYNKLIADTLREDAAAAGGELREKGRNNIIKVGAHKILIHLQVYAGKEEEAYYERLYDIPPDLRNNKAKMLQTAIELSDGRVYHIKAYVYPHGKIIVDTPCSLNPFPLWLQDRARTNKDFLLLLSQIYVFLYEKMRDCRHKVIPPTHNPCWRVKNCDIGFDIPATALTLNTFPDMQVKQFFNVAVSRIYAKMIYSDVHIRIEKACQHFDLPITENLGSTIIDEASKR